MVYLAKKDGVVIHHTSREAMAAMDGVTTPDMTVSDAEFDAAGGLVRLIDGAIVLGKTEAESRAEQSAARIAELRTLLADSDYIAVKIAEGSATKNDYADKIAERQAWRRELKDIEKNKSAA